MNETPTRKTKTPKAKVFGVYLIDDDGNENLIEYVEHHSKPQAQSAVLAGKIEVREADHHDMVRIGREGTPVRWLDMTPDEPKMDAFKAGGTD